MAMPLFRSGLPAPLPRSRRIRPHRSVKHEDGLIEGEFWVVARAVGVLIGGIVVLGWLLS